MNTVEPIKDIRQIEGMKKVLRGQSPRDWLLFVLGINSALRVSDLLRLRQSDVYDDRGRVLESLRIRESKTNKEKSFRLNASAKKTLEEYACSVGHHPEAYLFLSRNGDNKPISRGQAWLIINGAAKVVGITQPIGTHTLRKTFGYHAYKGGTAIELIMVALNHSSIASTKRYIGITQDDIDSVYISTCL